MAGVRPGSSHLPAAAGSRAAGSMQSPLVSMLRFRAGFSVAGGAIARGCEARTLGYGAQPLPLRAAAARQSVRAYQIRFGGRVRFAKPATMPRR